MQPKYHEWIANWLQTNNPYGLCSSATIEMQKAFPELIRVRGHYYCTIWGERMHWWLVDPNGEIVDPTRDQFPTKGLCVYQQWIEGDVEPTGLCPNCGEYCYNSKTCCSNKCDKEFAASMGIQFSG